MPISSSLARAAAILVGLLSASAAMAAETPVFTPLPNGVEVRIGKTVERIVALRPDMVRIRAGMGALPEDASWAALPQARAARQAVTPFDDGARCGFRTQALTVQLSKADGALEIIDAQGQSVLKDAADDALALKSGGGFIARKVLPDDEHIFGLGDRAGPLDRRGGSYVLWNTDNYGYQEGEEPLYKTLPFFIGLSGRGASGVFVDNTFRSVFDFGKQQRQVLSFSAEGGPLDYYVIVAPTPKQVVQAYAWLTGTPPLPPLWAFGFQQSRWSYMSAEEAHGIVGRYRKDRLPLDVLWLDIDYQDHNRPFTVNSQTFPDMPGLIQDLSSEGVHTVLITDLHIAKATGQGYAPYDSGLKGDHFLHRPDGSVYSGWVWPGDAVFPEFTKAKTRAWWGGLYKDFYAEGVAGFWNDMNEPAVFNVPSKTAPLDLLDRIDEPGFAPRTTTQAEIHNVFGMLNSRATFEGLLALKPDQRPFVMTRATYAGGQRYAVTWTGDNSSTWNHLRLSTPILLSLGLSGFGYAGDDLGGFAGSPSMELLTRWLEVGVFNPIARDHSEKGSNPQEPWVGGEPHLSIRRRFIEERYRLLPYIYTLAEQTSRDGTPMMRPLFLEFPPQGDAAPLDLSAPNEFLLGPDLLIAPAKFGEQPAAYPVLLPPGGWYDYWTGKRVEGAVRDADSGADAVTVTPDLGRLPVYVRAGAILPRQPLVQSTAETPKGPLELDVYPGPNCQGALYQDAGDGFGYRAGAVYRAAFRCQVEADGAVRVTMQVAQNGYRPWWDKIAVTLHGGAGARRIVTAEQLAAGVRLPAS